MTDLMRRLLRRVGRVRVLLVRGMLRVLRVRRPVVVGVGLRGRRRAGRRRGARTVSATVPAVAVLPARPVPSANKIINSVTYLFYRTIIKLYVSLKRFRHATATYYSKLSRN